MADLLTHVLAAYVLATVLSWRWRWITPPYVTVAMAGAIVPDLNRIELFVPAAALEATFGVPVNWNALHTLGGSLLVVSIGALLVPATHRSRVFVLAFLGVLSHLTLDLLLIRSTAQSYAVLWPLTEYRPPTIGLYLSTDQWPAAIALVVAGIVALETRRRCARDSERSG